MASIILIAPTVLLFIGYLLKYLSVLFVFISFWLNIKNENPVTMALNNWFANTIIPFCFFSNFNWYWQTNVVFVSWSKHLTEISVFSTPSFYLSKFPHTFNFQKISESLSKNLIFTLMWLQKKSKWFST